MRERRDVVVVGAGPAGAAAGICLADEHGLDTLVLDRAVFPRWKACAGGLGPAARRALERLGVWDRIVRKTQHVDSVRLEAPSAIPVTVRGASDGHVIHRKTLDAALVDRLRETPAELREAVGVASLDDAGPDRVLVTARGPGGVHEIEARWVVVAAGAAWCRRHQGYTGRTIHSVMARYRGVDHDRHAIEMQFTRELYPLYGWVFPEPGGICNIGIGIERHRMDGRPLGDVFRAFLATRLGERMQGAEMIGRPTGYPIMTTPWPGALGRTRVLLAGEAGRLVNPITGEGIGQALGSGILAARAVAEASRERRSPGRCLSRYTSDVRRELGLGLAVGEVLRTVGIWNLDWIIRYRRHLRGGRRILRFIAHV